MIAFKGRHKDIVHIPSKPIRDWFKVYMLAEAYTGWMLNWKIYSYNENDLVKNDNKLLKIVNCLT